MRTLNYVHLLRISKVDVTMHYTPHADSIHSDDICLSVLMRVRVWCRFCMYMLGERETTTRKVGAEVSMPSLPNSPLLKTLLCIAPTDSENVR